MTRSDPQLDRLRGRLAELGSVVVAFSGGVDSALLAYVAADVLGERALAVTAVSPSLAAAERAAARELAREHGIRHVEVATDEFEREAYRVNGGDRCFHCKSALLDRLEPIAELAGARVAIGTNTDDLGDHRPGIAAARLRDAVAPLVDAGLDKAAVRRLSAELGLATADKPAAPCLASRVAYGDEVTPELVGRIERAEAALAALGFGPVRVRAHAAGSVARIEVPGSAIEELVRCRDEVAAALGEAGFLFVAADLTGLRSGSLNLLLRG